MKYRKIMLISTGLLLFGTITPSVLPIIGAESVQAQEKGYLEAGKAYVEHGVINQDLVSTDGEVYPVGTKVARASRQDGVVSGSYYLFFVVGAFFFQGAGEVPEKYVTNVSSEVVQVGATGLTAADNPVSPGANANPLQPYSTDPVQVNKSELKNTIYQAEQATHSTIYTDDSISSLQNSLDKAYVVRDNNNATQIEVDTAVSELKQAITNLSEKPLVYNKQELLNTINKTKDAASNPDNYTVETYIPFKSAYDKALTIYNNNNAPQYDIDDAEGALRYYFNKLNSVSGALPVQVDKSQLITALDKATKLTDLTSYTEKSVNAFKAAKEKAEAINQDTKATQNDVDEATTRLLSAIDGLAKNPASPSQIDKTKLVSALDKATKLTNLTSYTEKSVNILKDAKEKAETINQDTKATQNDVDEATTRLLSAIDGLVEKPLSPSQIDKTKLVSALDKATKLTDLTSYTEKSVNAFKAAKEKAEAINQDTKATQNDVDKATDTLLRSIDNLAKINNSIDNKNKTKNDQKLINTSNKKPTNKSNETIKASNQSNNKDNKTLPKTNEEPISKLLSLAGGLSVALSALLVLKRKQ